MSDMIPFDYQGRELRTILINGEPWFVAKDACEILELEDVSKAVSRLDEDEKGTNSIPTPGGLQQLLCVNEPGLYSLILGSRKPEAKQFKRWITHEVIPAIRKHGGYLTPQKIEEVLSDPDTLIRLATDLKAERARNKRLQIENLQKDQVIHELQPKATYYDLVLQSQTLLTTTEISKDYGLSARALNNILREEKVQFKRGGQWFLYQNYAEKGYTQSRTYPLENGETKLLTCWTQKGRLFIYDLLKNKRGILPIIEREAM